MVVSVVDVSAGGAWVSPPPQAESMAVAARRVNFFNERLPIVPARSTKQRGPLPKVPWLGAVAASNFPEANIDQDFDRSVAARIVRDVRAALDRKSASELQSLMRISYAVFCLKKKKKTKHTQQQTSNKRCNVTIDNQ